MKHISSVAAKSLSECTLASGLGCLESDLRKLEEQRVQSASNYFSHRMIGWAYLYPKRDFYVDHGMGCLTVEIVPKGQQRNTSKIMVLGALHAAHVFRADGTKRSVYSHHHTPLIKDILDTIDQYDMLNIHIESMTTASEGE